MSPETGLLWLPAFMAGLLGSGHCFAMCGGIAGGLGAIAVAKPVPHNIARQHTNLDKATAGLRALQFNLGRLAGYALLGGLLAGLAGLVPRVAGLEFMAVALRLATAVLVALIGLRYALGWQSLDGLEKLGSRVWQRVAPLATGLAAGQAKSPGFLNRLLLGACWGFLPCGLVYTLLLTATATANAVTGATVMLAFGLGTLPSMLGLTLAAPALAGVLRDKDFRRFIGFSLVLLAAWMMFSALTMGPVAPGQGGTEHQHG
jgi:sulfite exporter TauE/SafE